MQGGRLHHNSTIDSPIPHAAVRIERALQQFLLERVLLHFRFVDLDAEAGPGVGPDDAAFRSRR